MITESLIKQIKYDEGVILGVYQDHLGYANCGVGPLILESDQSTVYQMEHLLVSPHVTII